MDLLENEQQIEKSKKTKVIMSIIVVMIVVLLCICIALLYMIYSVQKNTLKLNIDNKSITNFSEDIFLFEDNQMYIYIKEFAKLVGYEAHNGNHKSENPTQCYIENTNEEAAFELNSNKIYKTLVGEGDNEYFDISEAVKMKNNQLYVSIEGMQIGANCVISYNADNKQITVFTLPYLVTSYTGIYNNSAVAEQDADYSNQKALLYNMLVVTNENKKYGVIALDGSEIIGTKYTDIKFIESSKSFIVKTDDNKMGIVANNGVTKIEPNYDEIKQIDKDLNLYLVTNNRKQGVINQNGNIVVYLEYDQIGIDSVKFSSDEIKNQYLLFDKYIPVNRDRKWGIFDKNGRQVIPVEYDELGCAGSTGKNSTVVIPKYEAFVVGKDRKYGVIDSNKRELIPCILDSVYSITNAGEETYLMSQGENVQNVVDFIDTYVLKNEKNKEQENNSKNETTNQTTTGTNNQVANQTRTTQNTVANPNATQNNRTNNNSGRNQT